MRENQQRTGIRSTIVSDTSVLKCGDFKGNYRGMVSDPQASERAVSTGLTSALLPTAARSLKFFWPRRLFQQTRLVLALSASNPDNIPWHVGAGFTLPTLTDSKPTPISQPKRTRSCVAFLIKSRLLAVMRGTQLSIERISS